MTTALVPGFKVATNLGHFAEQLLMFDTVTIQVTRPHDVVQLFKELPSKDVEQLVHQKSIRLVLDHGMGLASSRRAAAVGDPEYVQQRVIAEPEDCLGYMVPFATKVNPKLLDELEYGLGLWTDMPKALRLALLSNAKTLPLRFESVVRQTRTDLQNPVVIKSALSSLHNSDGITLNEDDVSFFMEKTNRRSLSEADKLKEHILRRVVTRVMRANSNLHDHSLGFSVSGGSGDQAIFEAKLASVFQVGSTSPREQALGALYTLNNVPSVEQLVNSGALTLSDIIRLRSKEGRDFRKWFQSLWTDTILDSDQVLQEYTGMLTRMAKGPTISQRLVVMSLGQGISAISGLLGLAASVVQELIIPMLASKPYLLFESLRKYSSED